MPSPQNILVRAPNFVGDQVMARAFYRGLREVYPTASLTLLCTPSVAGLWFPEIFNARMVITDGERKHFPSMLAFSKKLRGKAFDLGISLPATFRAAMLLALSAIPHRVGFSQGLTFLFLTGFIPWKGVSAGRPKSSLYLDLLEYLSGRALEVKPEPMFPVSRQSYFIVAPGASIPLREWPYFEELLKRLSIRFPDRRLLVVGSEREGAWRSRLASLKLSGVEDLVGKTSLPELLELCRRASLVIANDSGVAHVAATLGQSPTLVLFGPGDPTYVTPEGPLVEICRVTDLPCSPCEKAYCRAPYGYQRCLTDLPLEAVMRSIERMVSD